MLELLVLLVVLVGAVAAHTLHLPDLALSILALPTLVLLPMLTGRIVVRFLNAATGAIKTVQADALARHLVNWCTGALSIVCISIMMQLLHVFTAALLVAVIIGLSCIGLNWPEIFTDLRRSRPSSSATSLVLIIAGFAGSTLPLIYFRTFTPFPTTLSAVIYNSSLITQELVLQGFVDTQRTLAYLPTTEILVSIPSLLLSVHPIQVLWVAPFAIAPLYFIGSYFLLRERLGATLGAFVGASTTAWIISWNRFYIFPPAHELQARVLTYVLFPFAVFFVVKMVFPTIGAQRHKRPLLGILAVCLGLTMAFLLTSRPGWLEMRPYVVFAIIGSLLIVVLLVRCLPPSDRFALMGFGIVSFSFAVFHAFEGVFYYLALDVLIVVFILAQRRANPLRLLVPLSLALTATFLWMVYTRVLAPSKIPIISVSFLGIPHLISPGYLYAPLGSLSWVVEATGYPILLVTLLGVLIGLRGRRNQDLAIILTFIGLSILYLLPVPEIQRAGATFTLFVAYFTGTALSSLEGQSYWKFSVTIPPRRCVITLSHDRRHRLLVFAAIVLIVVATLPNPLLTYISAMQKAANNTESVSTFTAYEYSAGMWILEHMPTDTMILSDPETMKLLSGVSGRRIPITSVLFSYQLFPMDLIRLEQIRNRIFLTTNATEASEYAYILAEGAPVIIAVSGRTTKWLVQNEFVVFPNAFERWPGFDKFFGGDQFTIVFSVPFKIYLFCRAGGSTVPAAAQSLTRYWSYSKATTGSCERSLEESPGILDIPHNTPKAGPWDGIRPASELPS